VPYDFLNTNNCRPLEIAIRELPMNKRTVPNVGAANTKTKEPIAAGVVKAKQKIRTFLEIIDLPFYYDSFCSNINPLRALYAPFGLSSFRFEFLFIWCALRTLRI
jgi:hypothetical protein